MRNRRLLTFSLAAAAILALGIGQARAADPEGCCCVGGTGGEACMEMTEKACLARQQAAPKYDEKTKYDDALKKSESEEAGKMKSGWKEGKCPAK